MGQVRPIRGRDGELATLDGVLAAGRDGCGATVLIEGDAGIGKTRLVHEVFDRARGLGFEILSSGALEIERGQSLQSILRATASIGSDAVSARQQRRFQAREEALLEALEGRALKAPQLLCVEDLHWADPSTLAFLSNASTRFVDLPLVLLGTFRPPIGIPELARVVDRMTTEGALNIPLDPLDHAAALAVARDVVTAELGPSIAAHVELARGNPFYVVELLSALDDEDLVVRSDGRAELVQTGLPKSLRVTILRRIAALPKEVTEVLRAASFFGSVFSLDDLAVVTSSSARDLLRSLSPALVAGVVEESDDRLAFRHDIVREVIYEDVPKALRKGLHRQFASELLAAGASAARVAPHMSAGSTVGDEEAIALLISAADEMAALGPGPGKWSETEYLLRAAELCDVNDSKRTELLARSLVGLSLTHRPSEAIALGEELVRSGISGLALTRAHLGIAVAHSHLGNVELAAERWRRIAALPSAQPRDRLNATAALAEIAMQRGDAIEAETLARTVIDVPETGDDVFARSTATVVLSLVSAARGHVQDAMAWGQRSLSLETEATPGLGVLSGARVVTALARAEADQIEDAIAELHSDLRYLERQEIAIPAIERHLTLAILEYARGDWDEALVEVEAATSAVFDERADVLSGLAIAARVHMHRGRPALARALIARGDEQMASTGVTSGADLHYWVKALFERDAGRPRNALELLKDRWDVTAQVRYARGAWRQIWPDFVMLALATDRDDLARDVLRAADEGARAADGIASASYTAGWIRGLVQNDAEAISSASDGLNQTVRVIEAARSSEDAGRVLARLGDDRAAEYLLRALERYDALGAVHDGDRVRAALRGLGIKRGSRRAKRRSTTGWESLTATERRVVDLVVEGLTNGQIGERLFVSRRTVQTHLRNVFLKLGMASRTELAAAAARRPL